MWSLAVILAGIAALLVVFAVMDLRARRRGVRYRIDRGTAEIDPALEAEIAQARARFQNGTWGSGNGS
jgi:hypothetical protein